LTMTSFSCLPLCNLFQGGVVSTLAHAFKAMRVASRIENAVLVFAELLDAGMEFWFARLREYIGFV
jgi:hypothetical protein